MPEHKVTYTLCTSNEIFFIFKYINELQLWIIMNYNYRKLYAQKEKSAADIVSDKRL